MNVINQEKIKNYDHVESKNYETYFEKGIIDFFATENNLQDMNRLNQLCREFGYNNYSTTWLNVRECIKNGATTTDILNQSNNHNLGEY